MKNKIYFFFIFYFLISPCYLYALDLFAVTDYVFDGDTFSAKVNLENGSKVSVRVRISNIDAPEIHGNCPLEIELAGNAGQRLKALLPKGTRVILSNIKDDKYLGRIDARVSLDGQDIGEKLISEKLARRYSGGKRMPWCPNNNEKELISK